MRLKEKWRETSADRRAKASAKWLAGSIIAGMLLLSATPSHAQVPFHKKKKVNKSTSADNTAEPDKLLYERAIDDIKHGRHEVGRLNMQTLINTYPDSEYLAKAKLAIADSYYKEGGTANTTQAIQAYQDFDVFFPMLPEAAYAQLQVAMAHFREMEKPDRDRTQALDAEDAFQTFLQKISERSAGAEGGAVFAGSARSAGGGRLPDQLFLLHHPRRQKGGSLQAGRTRQPVSPVQQGGSRAVDAGKYLGGHGKEGTGGALLRKNRAGISAFAAGSGSHGKAEGAEGAGAAAGPASGRVDDGREKFAAET